MMMMCEDASPSNLPLSLPTAAAAAAVSTGGGSSRSSLLAPGFRFHPTDEELVRYYLKRKVSGLPLRVDAIAEIDLYKWEPWDLPSLSRLRTRDMEWYFFSPLDRKHSNRSRTNRGTPSGYWKTTGKDRPVRHASRVVGMKKTLVFHSGRAPRGQRTNWVMHEYRLEEEHQEDSSPPPSAASSSAAQDPFVLCRIFQKSGSGPQNGAQYGAPFIEEEWEEAEEFPPMPEAESQAVIAYAPPPSHALVQQDYLQSDDFEQKQVLQDERESTEEPVGQDSGTQTEDQTIFLEQILDWDRSVRGPIQLDGSTNTNMEENFGMGAQHHCPTDQTDEYLELKDIFDIMNSPGTSNSSHNLLGTENCSSTADWVNEATATPEVDGTELCFDVKETAVTKAPYQMYTPSEPVLDVQPATFVKPDPDDHLSAHLTEDRTAFYDAPRNNPIYTNDIQFSPADFDMVDDLLAYFDATDNDVQYDFSESPGQLEFVNSAPTSESKSVLEVEKSSHETCMERGGSSKQSTGNAEQLKSMNEDKTAASDMQVREGWNKSLRKRAVDMLGSIVAPPARAEGLVNKGKVPILSATQSTSSIHVSAGLIDITVMRRAEHWTLHKGGDMRFLLSSAMAPDDVVGNSPCYEPVTKNRRGALPMLLRSGFYLFGISVLILSATLKMGMCLYSK